MPPGNALQALLRGYDLRNRPPVAQTMGEGKGMILAFRTTHSSLREGRDFGGSAKKGRGHEILEQQSPLPESYRAEGAGAGDAPDLWGRGLMTRRHVSLPGSPLALHYRPFPGQGNWPQSRKRGSPRA